jgi:phosphinothricin acetyltransferase
MNPSERVNVNDAFPDKREFEPPFLSGAAMNLQLSPISMADRKEIVDIFNHYIETSFAAFPAHPLPYDAFDSILNKCKGFPTVTAKDDQGSIVGFGLLHAYNPFPVFSGTAELSYFIKSEWTGRGIGTMMLDYLCQKAREKGITTLLASISSLNDQSLRFHRRKGFKQCGCFQNVGQKKSATFDIVYMQIFL